MRNFRIEKKNLFLSFFIVLVLPFQVFPCLILKIAHGDCVLAGNNEDVNNPLSKIWFEPPEEGKYGITYFGCSVNYPQGGMNDQGLFFDAVAGYITEWKTSPKRLNFRGNLNRKIMEECASVEEAIAVYDKYNKSSFKYARIFLADRTGTSAMVGWIDGDMKFIRDKGSFQAMGFKEETAISMLKAIKENKKSASVDDVKEILEACHQEGRYPTQYSNICDLKNNVIYMYLFHDYSTVVKFDAAEEYKKGTHHYDLLPFFPDNTEAKNAMQEYEQTLLDSYEKVMADTEKIPSRFGWRELSFLGIELTMLKHYNQAIDVLKLTAERYPEWRSYNNLAYAYKMAMDIELAIENYRKVLELDPENQNALNSIQDLKKKK
jgi:tetratricopeptide (TPR) repeat protein